MNTWSIVSLGLALLLVSFSYEVVSEPAVQIVNGTTADDGEFPYMVQLVNTQFGYLCGGAIIGPEWILSAGHCLQGKTFDTVVYGTNKLYDINDEGNYTVIKVKNWFVHPDFQYVWVSGGKIPIYDVGILQLEESIPFSATAQPIKIADSEPNATIPFHVQGVLSGWGDNGDGNGPTSYLQKINLQLLTDEECTQIISVVIFNSIHNICSDDYYNGECSGDSGSPYVINGTQYGISSWSYKPCGRLPGAYTRITNPEYRDWIKQVTNL